MLKKSLYLVEKYILPLFFLQQAFTEATNLKIYNISTVILILDDILKPILFALLLFLSSSKERIINFKTVIGLILSYGSLYFLKSTTSDYGSLITTIFYISIIFYLMFSIASLLTLGKSFAILPSYNQIIIHGPYDLIRHPIYSSYIHFFLLFLLFNFSGFNFILTICFIVGIFLRATEEEKVLSQDDLYRKLMNKPRFFKLQISLPLLITFSLIAFEYFLFPKTKKISVNISYPIYSLKPHEADDWSSFFVMNHIYLRFSSKSGDFRNRSVLESKRIKCLDEKLSVLSSRCSRIKFSFTLNENLQFCSGEAYTAEDFKFELNEIVKKKGWLLPKFRWCANEEDCFEFENVQNIQNRLESIYFRFGWSNPNVNADSYGVKPFCFKAMEQKDGHILGGNIISKKTIVNVSTTNKDADVFLFENSHAKDNLRSLNFYNPIYYFLVMNGSTISNNSWLSEEIISEIKNVFFKNNILQENVTNDLLETSYSPKVKISGFKKSKDIKTIAIPDFLQNCDAIEKELNLILSTYRIMFKCLNITEFVELQVKRASEWDAFISPLTPGLPGKNSFLIQYFNPKSSDSWLGISSPTKSTVTLLGASKGTMTLSKVFCSIKPNSLGLSDFTVDDLIECNRNN